MTTRESVAAGPDDRQAGAEDLHRRFARIWGTAPGWRQLGAVNHTTVGLRFILTGFVFFLIGGIEAMLMRTQLAVPNNDFVTPEIYNQLFTLHGTTMMFLFAVPILEGVAFYLLPKMIGARDMIFPRLSAYGYWCYLFGGILLYSSLLVGAAPDAGWFMYTPLSSREYTPGLNSDFWLLGITFVEISAVSAGIELVATILKGRAPGMAIQRMPLFAWYMLITGFMIIFGFPPLILGSILLEIERAFGWPFFIGERGGNALLWQHLFWLFGHPEVYIIFLPAAGIITTMIATIARRPVVGYSWVVLAVIATGFISFMIWVHHMFTVGIPVVAQGFFAGASMLVAIPSGIQVFAWIATLWLGRPVNNVPTLFFFGFLFIFVLGGLTGVMVALAPFDWQVHDTHFVVAHLHYVLVGGMVFPLLAGLYYWLPLFSGRHYSEVFGRLSFWLLFIGFNLTFLPMHLTGMIGMTRRIYTYPEGLDWEILNLVSTVGGFLMAAGVAAFAIDCFLHVRYGRPARANPWKAGSLEWALRMPAAPYNFISIPAVTERYPVWDNPGLPEQLEQGQGYLANPDHQARQTFFSSVLESKPECVVHLPKNTYLPLVLGLVTALFFTGFLLKWYWLAGAGLTLMIPLFLAWFWRNEATHAPALIDAGHGLRLPTQARVLRGPGWWGLMLTILADAALYGSLLFGFLFLWTVAPQWPPPEFGADSLVGPSIGLALLVASSAAMSWGRRGNRRDQAGRLRVGLVLSAVLAALFAIGQYRFLADFSYGPTEHAYGAVVFAVVGCHLLHLFIALLMNGFTLGRSLCGHVDAERAVEPENAALFWHYMVAQWVVGYAVIHGLPLAA